MSEAAEKKISEIERLIVERMGGYCVVDNPTDEMPCFLIGWSNHTRWQKMAVSVRDMESAENPTAAWITGYFHERHLQTPVS